MEIINPLKEGIHHLRSSLSLMVSMDPDSCALDSSLPRLLYVCFFSLTLEASFAQKFLQKSAALTPIVGARGLTERVMEILGDKAFLCPKFWEKPRNFSNFADTDCVYLQAQVSL